MPPARPPLQHSTSSRNRMSAARNQSVASMQSRTQAEIAEDVERYTASLRKSGHALTDDHVDSPALHRAARSTTHARLQQDADGADGMVDVSPAALVLAARRDKVKEHPFVKVREHRSSVRHRRRCSRR